MYKVIEKLLYIVQTKSSGKAAKGTKQIS